LSARFIWYIPALKDKKCTVEVSFIYPCIAAKPAESPFLTLCGKKWVSGFYKILTASIPSLSYIYI
jgi:hypothetical protein